MRVDRDRRLAEGEQQHDIGAFSTDPRQLHQSGTILRHGALMPVQ
tara:strand:+ start:690 stop:824 length:135 start_codon:yes stop_codon:yes gene_type:complete